MMPVHPAAELFPMMSDVDFRDLVEDIRANGLHDAIVTTPQREILDGRHRYRACMEVGVDAQFRVYRGEPWRYVISTNLHRRHLSDTQRAMVAAQVADRLPGRPKKTTPADAVPAPSQTEAREIFGVSKSALNRARTVHTTGTDSLVSAVESGTVTLSAAAELAHATPATQDAAVAELSRPRHAESSSGGASPEPRTRQRRPKPLPQAAAEAGRKLRKITDTACSIVNDDRFVHHADEVACALRADLIHVVDTAHGLLAALPATTPDAATAERAAPL